MPGKRLSFSQRHITRECVFSYPCITLTLTPMTLILDLDILKMYLHTKNEVCRSKHSKVTRPQHTETHFGPVTLTLTDDLDIELGLDILKM